MVYRPCGLGALPALLLATWQHLLLPFDALTEHFLKRGVTLPLLDMLRDCRADHARNGLPVDGCDRVQLLRLVGRQANRHGFDCSHVANCAAGGKRLSTTKMSWYYGGVVSFNGGPL